MQEYQNQLEKRIEYKLRLKILFGSAIGKKLDYVYTFLRLFDNLSIKKVCDDSLISTIYSLTSNEIDR